MKQLDCTALQKHIIPPLPRVFDEEDVENDEKTNFLRIVLRSGPTEMQDIKIERSRNF